MRFRRYSTRPVREMRSRDTISSWLYAVVPALVALLLSIHANAAVGTRIISINGGYSLRHAPTIDVHRGDTVSLSADLVESDSYGALNGLDHYAEEFVWNTDLNSNDFCDVGTTCDGSNFTPTPYGVNFTVPYTIGDSVTIFVRNKTDGSEDRLILVNADFRQSSGGGYNTSPDQYTEPERFPTSNFDYNTGLAGYGNWVYPEPGVRAFAFTPYVNDWAPYQHGRWVWTSYGWTWVAYTPAEEILHHMGYFRHHRTYGWLWFPFPDYQWRPHAVTFFHSDAGVGWYPYYNGYTQGYARGYAHGYDDGYWDGLRAGFNASYTWGWTYVPYSGFMQTNIYSVRVTTINIVTIYNGAYASGYCGPVLIGRGYNDPRLFIQAYSRVAVPVTPITVVNRGFVGGRTTQWVQPVGLGAQPDLYRNYTNHAIERARGQRPMPPVGSVVNGDGSFRRPTAPPVAAPRVPDGNGGSRVMPPRTQNPGRWNGQNPNVPAPAPTRPNPQPQRPAPMPQQPGGGGVWTRPSQPGGGYTQQPQRPMPAPQLPAPQPGGGYTQQPQRPAPMPQQPGNGGGWTRPSQPGGGYTQQPQRPAPIPQQPQRPAPMPQQPGNGGGWSRPSQPNGGYTPQPQRPTPPSNSGSFGGGISRPNPGNGNGGGYSRPAPAPSQPSRPAPGNGGGFGGGGRFGGRR